MEKHLPMPESSALIKGEIADYHYGEDGILYSYSKSPKRTVENIFRNIELVRQITGNKKAPLRLDFILCKLKKGLVFYFTLIPKYN